MTKHTEPNDDSTTGENENESENGTPEYDQRTRELLDLHGDRDRGALTSADREFLIHDGDNVSSEATRYSTRHRIHNRLKNAILDWSLIAEKIPDGDLKRAFAPKDDVSSEEMQTAIRAMFEATYRATALHGKSSEFEEALQGGIHDALLLGPNPPALVNVEFDVTTSDEINVEDAYQKYQDGNWLSTAEHGALLASGKVAPEEAADLAEYAQTNTYFPGVVNVLGSENYKGVVPSRPPDDEQK